MTYIITGNTGDDPSLPSPLRERETSADMGQLRVGEGAFAGGYASNATDKARLNAKSLRSEMTDVEKKLWYHLRAERFLGYKFRRQQPIGSYIVDFVCLKHGVIIELDGGQHGNQRDYDRQRDAYLNAEGFHVLRFWNNDVNENLEGVLLRVKTVLEAHPLPNPLPQGRGDKNIAKLRDNL